MIKNKTYRNFLIIKNRLMREKGYAKEEASKIAHLVFENVYYDKDYGNRSAEFFYDLIVPADKYNNQ